MTGISRRQHHRHLVIVTIHQARKLIGLDDIISRDVECRAIERERAVFAERNRRTGQDNRAVWNDDRRIDDCGIRNRDFTGSGLYGQRMGSIDRQCFDRLVRVERQRRIRRQRQHRRSIGGRKV